MNLIHGDCLDVMAAMEPESVDAICTDPPYGLEFMGKEWDRLGDHGQVKHTGPAEVAGGERGQYGKVSFYGSANRKCRTCGHWEWSGTPCKCEKPDFPNPNHRQGQLMQEWHARWAEAAYRVAKPSAYLLAFGGTRTVHRMTVALEDAGWIIRDMLVWAYACLSDDTEILTEEGWVRYNSPNVGQLAAAFDPDSGELRWERIQAVHRYQHEGEMAELGPSLVTLNHRVVIDKATARVPRLPGVWNDVRPPVGMGQEGKGLVLLESVQRNGTDRGSSESSRHVVSGATATAIRDDDGSSQSGLEGRRYRVQEARELFGRALRAEPGVGAADGAQGRLRDGAPPRHRGGMRVPADQDRGREPRGPRSDEQRPDEPDALAGQPDAQALRMGQVPDRDGGPDQVRLVDYAGTVWCITVPTGAFLARRGGVVFVTGNSGFPKSKASLKPAWEPIVMARKPGPLRMLAIDACRLPVSDADAESRTATWEAWDKSLKAGSVGAEGQGSWTPEDNRRGRGMGEMPAGRWPANVILTDEVFGAEYSRFFLIPKADRGDREPVLGGLTGLQPGKLDNMGDWPNDAPSKSGGVNRRNVHPTVKPVDLMRHLVRLVTPTGGTVLDPFLGSGTTALAAEMEGFPWIGIEREAEYVAIAEARLNGTQRGLGLPA